MSKPARYCFAQQRDNSCHMLPFINLHILKNIRARAQQHREKPFDLSHQAPWYTKREWIAQTYLWTSNWERAIKSLAAYRAENLPFLRWQKDQLDNGIIMGQMYTDEGKNYYDHFFPLVRYLRIALTPFTFTATDFLSEYEKELVEMDFYKTLPIFRNKQYDLICYNPETKVYETLTPLPNTTHDLVIDYDFSCYNLHTNTWEYYDFASQAQREYFNLPNNCKLKSTDTREGIMGFEHGYGYLFAPKSSLEHSYYYSSAFTLILLALGVDRNNQTITEAHPMYGAYLSMQAAMQSVPNNPWALETFTKENLLEYHITNAIKASPTLKAQMIDTIDVMLPSWKSYEALETLYDSPDKETRSKLSDKKEYLCDEDQMLAYKFSQCARFLWAAAQGDDAFCAVLEIDPRFKLLFKLPGMPSPSKLVRNAYQPKECGLSFIEVWQRLLQFLWMMGMPREVASYSSHGTLMSFEEDFLTLQEDHGPKHASVMRDLGFAIVDSYYGEELDAFYRSTNVPEPTEPCSIDDLIKPVDPNGKSVIFSELAPQVFHYPSEAQAELDWQAQPNLFFSAHKDSVQNDSNAYSDIQAKRKLS